MSYEKHTWETGETITAEKLNNIEEGIGENSNFIVTITIIPGEDDYDEPTYTVSPSVLEIVEAINMGKNIICTLGDAGFYFNLQRMQQAGPNIASIYFTSSYTERRVSQNYLRIDEFIMNTNNSVDSIVRKTGSVQLD